MITMKAIAYDYTHYNQQPLIFSLKLLHLLCVSAHLYQFSLNISDSDFLTFASSFCVVYGVSCLAVDMLTGLQN